MLDIDTHKWARRAKFESMGIKMFGVLLDLPSGYMVTNVSTKEIVNLIGI